MSRKPKYSSRQKPARQPLRVLAASAGSGQAPSAGSGQVLQRKLAEAYREQQAGRLEEAKQLCLQILEVDPHQPDCLNLLGALQNHTGQFADAANVIRRAIALNGKIAPYHANLGFALQSMGKLPEAIAAYRQAAVLRPDFADGLSDLGGLLLKQGEREEARAHLERALLLQPDHPAALNNLGTLLRMQGELERARTLLERALVVKPDSVEALSALGAVLWQQGALEQAEILLQRALVLKPDHAEARLNLAVVFEAQGQRSKALAAYERTLALKPDFAEAQWNRGLLQLLVGDFAAGWHNYQWRYQVKAIAPRSFPQPLWRGEPLHGARILLHAEQGLGDTLQFLRYLPMVCAAGGTVLLDVPGSMRRLAEQLPGIAAVTVPGEAFAPFDWQCPLMDLPLVFRTTLETIPARVPYLSIPDAARQSAAALSWPEQGLRAGLVWSGAPTHMNDRNRSLPLALLAPLFALEGVHLFSLQLGPGAAQLASFPGAITDLAPAIGDLADTAALMGQLDLVITVDTAVAHLAGALARPVWVLLPFVPDWRWLLGRDDSPWYPTMRLFRQPERSQWAPVVARVRAELVGK